MWVSIYVTRIQLRSSEMLGNLHIDITLIKQETKLVPFRTPVHLSAMVNELSFNDIYEI